MDKTEQIRQFLLNLFLADPLTFISNIATILGAIFATIVYFKWKKNYAATKAHDYAIDLLTKVRMLHLEIESLRAPKFYSYETVLDEIHNEYIPYIESKILKKARAIEAELLVAKECLVKHKDIQTTFVKKIKIQIIEKIIEAINLFKCENKEEESNEEEFDYTQTDLWMIIFPSEKYHDEVHGIIQSHLGTGSDVIDDHFNKIIVKNFNEIYSKLKANLATK